MKRFLATALLALALPVWAQPQGGHPGREGAPRDEAFRVAEAYLLSNLQEGLGLSDEQFAKMLPLVKRVHADRRDFEQRRHETLAEMRRLLKGGGASEGKVVDLLKQLRSIEIEQPEALRRDYDAIDQGLTTVQQAKYRVLEMEVMRKIRELADEVRFRRGGRLGREGPGPGGRRPDDDGPREPRH